MITNRSIGYALIACTIIGVAIYYFRGHSTNSELDRQYLALVDEYKRLKMQGADPLLGDRLRLIAKQIQKIDIGSDSCFLEKQDSLEKMLAELAAFPLYQSSVQKQVSLMSLEATIAASSVGLNAAAEKGACSGRWFPQVKEN